ncbi:probable rRNA maturation factor [Nitratiruptor sp. YY08-26]|uniref:rRNA maturation RNase YbeY n=1 Tax=unclassified Nitratiruptor TaxID=2624044 RepID=UPI001915DAB6|nr:MULTISPECIES: rRNA maturation RNase YbeY [unclassified Nitratiruptor]BCD62139.1 probable rRNA maturation factor [Nitratiruptor sp. YY08-13]BCD66075.1 probable rRNA maturation factor [Nitratiruptor sp. YY08-26]
MIELDNRTKISFDITIIEKIADLLTDKDIELLIVDNEEIRKLNKLYRSIDKPTDVLSFPLQNAPMTPLGSIVISIEKAQEAAKKFGHTLDEEIALLFTHGLLHLLGYDHETDSGQMRKKEQEIIEHFNLPKSLIVRTEE